MCSSLSNLMSISAWPAVPTSWCCISTSMPHSISLLTISERRSAVVVGRRDREVAALVARLVGQVAAGLVPAGVPGALDRVEVVVALVRAGGEPRGVEDVELGLRPEVRRVSDAAAAQVLLGLLGDVARVPAVGLAGQRVVHEERQVERLVRAERVDDRGRRVRQQQHVGLVDLLEAADRRAVEHQPVGEYALLERRRRAP